MRIKVNFPKLLSKFLLVLLLIIGILLIFNEQIGDFFVKKTGENYAIWKLTKENIDENNNKKVNFDFDKVQSMTTENVLKSQVNKTDLPVIGGIAIPAVSINLPIFKGIDNISLLYGAGTLSPNQRMGEGNYALASHRASNPQLLFTPLEDLKINDKIYLVDLDNVYTYKAKFKQKVAPTETQLLNVEEGKKIVTLITCGDMDGITRLVVQGELENVTSMEDATTEMKVAFDLPTKTF